MTSPCCEAHYQLACIYYKEDNVEAAINHIDAVLKVNPTHAHALQMKRDLWFVAWILNLYYHTV